MTAGDLNRNWTLSEQIFDVPQPVLDGLFEAAVGRQGWAEALQRTARHFRSEAAVMVSYNDTSEVTVGSEEIVELGHRYNEEGWATRDVRARAALSLRRQAVIVDQDIGPLEDLVRTPFYAEFMGPAGYAWHAAVKFQAGGRLWALSFQRGTDNVPFSLEEKESLERFTGPLTMIGLIANETLRARLHGTLDGLQSIRRAALAIDCDATVLERNMAAEALDGEVYCVRSRRLAAGVREDDERLAEFVAGLFSGTSAGPRQIIVGSVSGCSYAIKGMPLSLFSDHPFGGATAVLIMTNVDPAPAVRKTDFAPLFGLTPAEGQLADLVGSGHSLDDACEVLAITRNTARDRLKSVFVKTGTHRQSELVRLWLRLQM